MTTQLRVAGSDTREVLATRSVRLAGQAALVGAAPGWAAAFMAAAAWDRHLGLNDGGVWLIPLGLVLGVGAAITAWRLGKSRIDQRSQTATLIGVALPAAVAGLAFLAGMQQETRLISLALPLICVVSGLVVADAALLAARASMEASRSAASGLVSAYALAGLFPGVHIMLVGQGAGAERAAKWSAVYLVWSVVATMRAHRALPIDLKRIELRERSKNPDRQSSHHALDLHQVTVRFGPNLILDRASLTVASGELVALVGGNGAGKSTLLRAAAGFVPIETGQVQVKGEDATALLPEERVMAGLSFVSGARPVFPEMTIEQNLRVASYRSHRSAASFEAATESLLQLAPTLADRRNSLVGVLSGGEQRLLAVLQSLYRRPSVLLADELTLGLDIDARHAVMDLLLALANEGVAVVCVDHDLPSLLTRCHRAALIADGIVTDQADPVELLTTRTDLLPATFLAGVDA